jgi:hypothetical protein
MAATSSVTAGTASTSASQPLAPAVRAQRNINPSLGDTKGLVAPLRQQPHDVETTHPSAYHTLPVRARASVVWRARVACARIHRDSDAVVLRRHPAILNHALSPPPCATATDAKGVPYERQR